MAGKTMKSDRIDCSAAAVGVVKIHVPAKGWPIEYHQPLTAIIGVNVCPEHGAPSFTKELLGDPLKRTFKAIATASQRAEPDFDRAWFTVVPFGSKELAQMAQQQAKGHTVQ